MNPAFLQAVDEHWVTSPWRIAWTTGDIEGLTLGREGLSICSCGCGKPWGCASAFPAYEGGGWLRGKDANLYEGSAPHILRQLHSKTHSILLQDPGLKFGSKTIVADLSTWQVDDATVGVFVAEAESTPLRVLKFSLWQGPLLTSQHIVSLMHSCAALRHLHIPGCDALDDVTCAAMAVTTSAPQLLSLDISFSSALTDTGLDSLTKGCRSLKTLMLASCPRLTDAGLEVLVSNLRFLETLDVSWSIHITEFGLSTLVTEGGAIKNLGMRGLGLGYKARNPAQTLARRAGGGAVDLEDEEDKGYTFNASAGSRPTTASSVSLAQSLGSAGLPVLDWGKIGQGLAGKPFMLGRVLGARMELLCRLSEVNLEGAVGVNDVVVMMLAKNTEGNLTKLNLNHATALTSVTTTAIAMFCPILTHLHLAGCTGLASPLVDATVAASLLVQTGKDRSAGLIPDPSVNYGMGWGIGATLQRLNKAGPRKGVPPPWEGEEEEVEGGGPQSSRQYLVPPHVHYDAQAKPRPKWTTLKLLDLTGVTGVWEADIVQLVARCADIREIRLGGCSSVTDSIIPALSSISSSLKHLRLPFLPALSDLGCVSYAVLLSVCYLFRACARALAACAEETPPPSPTLPSAHTTTQLHNNTNTNTTTTLSPSHTTPPLFF